MPYRNRSVNRLVYIHMDSAKTRFYKLVRWSEQYTKTNTAFVFSTGWWSATAQVASACASLALALVVAHFVPKEQYGEYQFIISVISTLSIFSLSGIGNAVLQSVAHGFDQSLIDGVHLNLKWSAGVAIAGSAVGLYYLYHGNSAIGLAIIIGSILSPIAVSLNLHGWFLSGKGDARRSALYPNGIGNVLPIAGIIIAALLFHTGMAMVLGYVFANTLTLGFLFWRTLKVYPLNDRHDAELRRYGFHLSAINVLNTVGGNIANLLLFHILGGASVAIYNFAISIPDQFRSPLSLYGAMMTSRFTRQTSASIRSTMYNKMLVLFIAMVFGVGAYLLAAPLIYTLLFPAYDTSIVYSQLYVLSLFALIFTPASSFLIAHKHVKAQYFLSAFSGLFQIVAVVAGVFQAGILGAVVAVVVTRIATGIVAQLLYWYFSRAEALVRSG